MGVGWGASRNKIRAWGIPNTRSSGEIVFERRSKHIASPSVPCRVGGWMTITRERAKTRSHLNERFGGRGLHDAFDLLQVALHRLDSAKHGANHFEKLGNVGLRTQNSRVGWFRGAGARMDGSQNG